jgi:hypothetical protein
MKHPGGRPTKYNEEVLNIANEYKNRIWQAPMMPTIEGLADELDVDSDTINNWATAKDESDVLINKEFFGTIKAIKNKQKKQLMEDGMYGGKEVNSTMAIFLLKANHGMIETERKLIGGDEEHPIHINATATLDKIYGDIGTLHTDSKK